jgi:flagellar M-ring protein FliF
MSSFWQEVLARPREIFGRLSRGQRFGVLALVAVGVVVAGLASLLAGRESWVVLYGGLDASDAKEVSNQLSSSGVPYRISADGSQIQVPEQRLSEIRMQLASAGLPKGGSEGWSLFDATQFGMTDQLFKIQYDRALSGVLAKDIESLDGVRKASVRVTVAPPGLFAKDKPRSTAGVTLTLRPGANLADSGYAAIAFLIASAVGNGMRPQDVTIIDTASHLLYPRGDSSDPLASLQVLEKVQTMEKAREEKAESQLRAAGVKASVRVSIELDPTYKEKTRETVSDENRATARETSSTDRTGSAAKPAEATAAAKSKEVDLSGHDERETEYKNGVQHELEITGAGSIRFMSVSVLFDDSPIPGPDGKPGPAANADKISQIVQNAVGYSKTRKDAFSITPMPFLATPAPPPAPGPFAIENLLPLAGHLTEAVTVLFVLFLLFKVVRGGLRSPAGAGAKSKAKGAAGGPAAEGEATEGENEFTELTYAAEGKAGDLRTRLTRFVTKHPDQAREVLLAWLKEEMTN